MNNLIKINVETTYLSSESNPDENKYYFLYTVLIKNTGDKSAKLLSRHWIIKDDNGKMKMNEVTGTEFSFEADLVLLAMGFVHPIHEGLINSLGVNLTPAGNLDANDTEYKTSIDNFFAAGDSRRGQSLVVWAIKDGRDAAENIDKFLKNKTQLKQKVA